MKNWIRLSICLISLQAVGVFGGFVTGTSVRTWYLQIEKPLVTPPSWVFATVWPLLFFLMGISIYLVWKQGLAKKGVKTAIAVFSAQIFFNSLWSIVFFGFQSIGGGLIVIFILFIFILLNIVVFYRLSKPAGILLLPYIMWISFAIVLNFLIFQLN